MLKYFRRKNNVVIWGRWSKLHCEKQLSKRIELANEDNCGVCYSKEVLKANKNFKKNKKELKKVPFIL